MRQRLQRRPWTPAPLRLLPPLALVVLLVTACADRGGTSSSSPSQAGDGIHQVAQYGQPNPQPINEALTRPEYVIAVAVVESAETPRWNTPDHHRPTEQESRGYMVMSPFQIKPLKVLRGSLPTNEVVVEGGVAGPDSTQVNLWPAGIKVGGTAFLILIPQDPPDSSGALRVLDAFPIQDTDALVTERWSPQGISAPTRPGQVQTPVGPVRGVWLPESVLEELSKK